jgi:hypothetical protein
VEERNRDVGDAEPELREKNSPTPCIQHPASKVKKAPEKTGPLGAHSAGSTAGTRSATARDRAAVIGVLEVWHGFAWACPFSVCWAICWVLLPVGRRPAGPLHPCGALFLFLALLAHGARGARARFPCTMHLSLAASFPVPWDRPR